MQIRAELKKRVPSRFWPFLRKIDKYIIYITYVILGIRRSFQRKKLLLTHPYPQSVPVFLSKIPFNAESARDVESILSNAGLICQSGRHSVYLGREADISRINENIIENYPAGVGLKVIKSRQLAPDNSPFYTSSELAPASTYWSMTAIGSIAEKKAVTNLLYTQGVAPRVYDLIKLQSENGAYQYAFVVEHIDGDVLHGPEGEQFIRRFKEVLSLYGMETISISEHSDLRPPEFRNNIICGADGARYVDIQNFVLSDPGITRKIKRDFYQNFLLSNDQAVTIGTETGSGMFEWRNYSAIANTLHDIVKRSDIPINKSVIFTRSRRAVIFLPCLLNLGALWVHLFEKRESALTNWLFLNGFSRFSCGDNIQDLDRLFQETSRTKPCIMIIDDEMQCADSDIINVSDYILVLSKFSKSDKAVHDKLTAYGFYLKYFNHLDEKIYVHVFVKTQGEGS